MVSFGRRAHESTGRDRVIASGVVFLVLVCAIRLGQLQIGQGAVYRALAADQRDFFTKLLPERGDILVHEKGSTELYPVATNRDVWTIYSDNRKITDAAAIAKKLAPLLFVPSAETAGLTPKEVQAKQKADLLAKEEDITKHLSFKDDPYEPLVRGASDDLVESVRGLGFENIHFAPERVRYYSDKDFGGQVLGFVGWSGDGKDKTGRYGVEGYWEKELSGAHGYLASERDPAGGFIAIANRAFQEKQDGSDLVLTVDRTLQAYSCSHLRDWVEKHGAKTGSITMLEVKTGKVLALCGAPDFDPNTYSKVDSLRVYNNPAIFDAYEPGSVMKTITMAAAIDAGKVLPSSTYMDMGEEKIDDRVIKNSDGKAHGIQTMTQVLDDSLNTGAVYAMRQIGPASLKEYLRAFRFGTGTGIELDTEVGGNLMLLDKRGEIFAATASYGQGMTATALQVASAYGAIANGGKLMKPYIVDEIRHPDGTTEQTKPRVVSQVISQRAASLVSGMLVSVVQNGHGRTAKVPGYFVAGKTGTAQIPRLDGPGYEEGATIGTFAGFAPVSDPRFVLVVRIDRPKDTQYAETSAAPLFGDIAGFALQYLEVPPDDIH